MWKRRPTNLTKGTETIFPSMDTITISSFPFPSLQSGRHGENIVLGFIQEKYSDRLPPLSIAAHQIKYGAWYHSNCSRTAFFTSYSSAHQGFLRERLTPLQQLWAWQTSNYDATGCYSAPGLIHSLTQTSFISSESSWLYLTSAFTGWQPAASHFETFSILAAKADPPGPPNPAEGHVLSAHCQLHAVTCYHGCYLSRAINKSHSLFCFSTVRLTRYSLQNQIHLHKTSIH